MSDVIAGNFNTHITNFICGLLDIYKVYETTLRLAFFSPIFFLQHSLWGLLTYFMFHFKTFWTHRNEPQQLAHFPEQKLKCQMITCSTRQVLQLYTPFTYLSIYCFLKLIRFRWKSSTLQDNNYSYWKKRVLLRMFYFLIKYRLKE